MKLKIAAAVLAVLALTTPSSAVIDLHAGANAEGTKLYHYENKYGTLDLTVEDGKLWCNWNAPALAEADFLPSYYFTKCFVQNADGGPSIGGQCRSDSLKGTGYAVGSCQIGSVPNANLRLWAGVLAMDIRIRNKLDNSTSGSVVSDWRVSADWSTSLSGEIGIGGTGPSAKVGAESKLTIGAEAGESREETYKVDAEREMWVKSVLTVSLGGVFVKLTPSVFNVSWTGASYGCDALNLVEEAMKKPRQVGAYANSIKAQGFSGALKTDLSHTRLHAITNEGGLQVKRGANDFTAFWGGGADDAGTLLGSLSSDASGGGMPLKDTTIGFEADYEVPEGYLKFSLYTDVAPLGVVLTPSPGALSAVVSQVPGVVQPSFIITTADLAARGHNLARTVAEMATGRAMENASILGYSCTPTSAFVANKSPQTWTAALNVRGASGSASMAKTLGVDVYLDLQPYT